MQGDAVETTETVERTQIGPTLIGGIVGAAVGIGLHLILETGILGTRPYEASWFAIVIGLFTGLGVRWANKHHMERSYLRGAISGFLALGAILLSTVLISKVMAARDAKATGKPIAGAAAEKADDAEEEVDDEAADEAPVAEPAPVREGGAAATGGVGRPPGPDDLNPWQFVFMALGGLVAYEFGRGIDHSKRIAPAGEPAPPRPTNPSE